MKRGILIYILCLFLGAAAWASGETLDIYLTGMPVQRYALSSVDSISFDEAGGLMYIHQSDGSVRSIYTAEVDSMGFSSGEYSLPSVETVSAAYEYDLGKALCEVDISKDGGCGILERGICWSKQENPTIADNKSPHGLRAGEFYAATGDLETNTKYYVRAYATNCMGTSYGEPVEVSTIRGNVTYTLGIDPDEYPEYYNLIKTAMDSACYYYSRYTSFEANIYVYYNAGIPTAQANYHGSVGFGPHTVYMWVGTAMHEMAHYFGSGTTTVWKSLMLGGIWQGSAGQSLCQELTGTTLRGESGSNPAHYWPTGINYRHEVNSATDLINHCRIVQAMLVEDCGLPTSW
jgi:hypothetical protein